MLFAVSLCHIVILIEGLSASKVTILWRYRNQCIIIRPHRSTTYLDVAYCYRPSSVVCRSVCRSVCHTSERCKNGCTDQDAVWVEDLGGFKEPCIRWGPDPPMVKGNFEGKGQPIVKFKEYHPWAVAMQPFVKLLLPIVITSDSGEFHIEVI